MDQNAVKLYESLFTIEEMLTEVVGECANASKFANQAQLSEVSRRLQAGLLEPLQEFLDQKTPTSMSTLIEIADGIPAPRLTESTPRRQYEETSDEYEDEDQDENETDEYEQYEEYSQTGDPKYDSMFNGLLESSKELTRAGRKFKLDEIDKPDKSEIEEPIAALPDDKNPPPQMPGQKEKVEFDGMENWRSVLSEGSPGPSGPAGGDAGDIVSTLSSLSENDVEGLTPSANPPKQSNPNTDVDSDVSNILANL